MAGLPQRLKHLAVLRLPPCVAERMAEEWQAHLDDTPAPARTLAALGFVLAAMRCKLVARFGPITETEILMKPVAARYMAAALQRRVAALKRDQDRVDLTEIVHEVEEAFQGERCEDHPQGGGPGRTVALPTWRNGRTAPAPAGLGWSVPPGTLSTLWNCSR